MISLSYILRALGLQEHLQQSALSPACHQRQGFEGSLNEAIVTSPLPLLL